MAVGLGAFVTVSAQGASASPRCAATDAAPLVALTGAGRVVEINSNTLAVERTLAGDAAPDGEVTSDPARGVAFITANGPGGQPTVLAVPLGCSGPPRVVVAHAELPAVSPDGSQLAYVPLDGRGQQLGVAITALGADGRRAGHVRLVRAVHVPPQLAVKAVALGPGGSTLAVWGGFEDHYLGPKRPTVGTLTVSSKVTLASATAVFDAQGISEPFSPGRHREPKAWQSAPAYLANGELLVGDLGGEISMPFTDGPGMDGGGFRTIVHDSGPVLSIAAGPTGDVAWVGRHGAIEVERRAADLPFGPEAQTAPTAQPKADVVRGAYVRGLVERGKGTSPVTPQFAAVAHLPSVVGLSEPAAAQVMAKLALPVFVGHRVAAAAGVAHDIVVAQDPPAGYGVACDCDIDLTVTR